MYVKTHFSVLSPPQCWSQAVVCISISRVYMQSGYFLLNTRALIKYTYLIWINKDTFSRTLLHEGLKGTFLSTNGLDGWLAINIGIGMAHSSFKNLFVQVGLLGLMRLIAFGYLKYFHYLIYKCYKKRELTKKTH